MPLKTLLMCHEREELDSDSLARWLASKTSLAGILIIHEKPTRMFKRIRREIKRVGVLRFLDVFAFKVYYRVFISRKDRLWIKRTVASFKSSFPDLDPHLPILRTHNPNTPEARRFIAELRPDIAIARCKAILKEEIFSIPKVGTFVMHPGVCPEYRNAHGCFWALAEGRRDLVGMTLLKVDSGVDTGPVFGYFSCDFDESSESHVVIQHRVVLDNLESIAARLHEIADGRATPVATNGRKSGEWGQPWLSSYLRINRAARVAQ